MGLDKIRVGISTCLLGEKVRYDGGHKLDRYIVNTLGRFFQFVPVCPEHEAGYPIPRPPFRLEGDKADPRLVTPKDGEDHTDRMKAWSADRLDELEQQGLCGYILKSRSPSCGLLSVKLHDGNGRPAGDGSGLFARALADRFPDLPVEEESHFGDPHFAETFIERVSAYQRRKGAPE
jgi:uncharacterized protein YbbK (DUF523 family)